jgi:hypothetical protein
LSVEAQPFFKEAAMPKTISVELKGVSGDFDEAIGPEGLSIQGEIFGITLDGAPEARTDIFGFPNGPLTIRNGQMTQLDASAAFTLINPTFDPPSLAGKQLKFGARLIRADASVFGENFRTATTFFPTPEGSRDTIVRVVDGNQEIKLHFFLEVTTSF